MKGHGRKKSMKLKENEGASQREKCQRGRGYKAERGLLEVKEGAR